ncbi:unnamed protein product, partial [Rotaria sp. Silwood1]
MKLIIFLSAIWLITTSTWAYSNDCAKGPEYWCRDVSTAEDCGALLHCQQTVWREKGNDKKPMTTSETAQMLCNVIVQASIELVTDGFIDVNSIKQYLRNDCTKLPNENNLIHKCEMAVDLYLSDILRHIQSGTDLKRICPIIQGHDSESVFIPKPKPIGITPNQTCVLCEFIMNILEIYATDNSTAQELAQLLEEICQAMPDVLKTECKSFLDTYGVDIIALLVRDFSPNKTCALIKLCPKPTNVAFLIKPNANTCGLCDYISTYLSAGYPIENVCTSFSTDNNIRQQCEVLVHLYKPNYCSQLPICYEDVVIQPIEQSIETPVNSPQCALCKYVVSYIDAVVQNNKSEAAIEAALEKVCNILPGPIKDKCVDFVETYGPRLVQLIEKYVTPDQVCNALKLCHNGTDTLTPLERVQLMKFEKLAIKSIQCIFCKFVITTLDKSIGNNRTPAAIEAALQKVCDILPAPLKANCTTFVKKYGPIIAILLARNATPEQVCNFIKFCNNGTQEMTPYDILQMFEIKESTIQSAQCPICKYVVSYIDNIIQNNKSEAAIVAALEKVCTILPGPIKDKCDQFVVTYGPLLVKLIETYGTPEAVCNALKLCHNGTQEVSPADIIQKLNTQESTIKSPQCSLCKYVVAYIDNIIQNNKSEAAIEAALKKVCTILPGPIKDKCDQFVVTYGPVLVQLIEKYGTPEGVCNALKLCHNGTQEVSPVDLIQKLNIQESTIKSAQCSLCKYVVAYIDNIIQNNKSEAAIEAALKKVCTILPGPIKDKCDQFVVTYGPVLVQLIEKYGTPEGVCNALKLCHNGTNSLELTINSIDELVENNKQPVKVSSKLNSVINSLECSLCKYVVGYIDNIIQNNKSEAAIEAALEKVCRILPAPIKDKCVEFVDTYGPILVQLIEKYGTPDQVCNALKLCQNGTQLAGSVSQKVDKPIKRVKDSDECVLCKYIISYLNVLIENNVTVKELEKALELVCVILPAEYHKQCKAFVQTYGPILVELIVELDDPNVVCEWLTLCSKSNDKFIQIPAIKTNKLKSLPCNLCQYLVNYLDAIIQSNSTETKFEEALDRACKILPSTKLQSDCKFLVHLYGADLIKFLVEFGNPKTVCQAIALTTCLIYAYKQECAIGPEYWCKSFQNAQDCGALRHCTDTIWRYDEKHTKIDTSTKCEWCAQILENTHKAIQNVANNEDLVKSTLINGCKLLPLEDISSKCITMIENYETTVVLLMKHQRYDRICHLMNICQNSDIIELDKNIEKTNVDTQSKMLCNVIVRATQELHGNEQKSRSEIQTYLKNDCQKLSIPELVQKCEGLIERYGNEIYAYVVSRVELSKICDYIDDFAFQSVTSDNCELCTFVISIAKQMLDNKHPQDKVLIYIDEHICSHLTGIAKKNCKDMVDTNGKDLITNIQDGIQPMLLCTHFQSCLDKIIDKTSPIQKDEIRSFLMNNLCSKLGSLKSACEALIEKDSTHLLQVLINEINGHELCYMFGLCQRQSSLINEFDLEDDPNKCKRCITDFTRRKHIAEKLVNHSSEFLHHLCGQLPQQDDCTKAVDDSINELVTFIRSLDPRTICIQLKMCDQNSIENMKTTAIIPLDNAINENIIEYIKNDVCTKLGSLSVLCIQLTDSEGLNLLSLISKTIDPHRICSIIDVCPSNSVLKTCHDKCQCCTNKVEIYQRKLLKFTQAIVGSTRIMCDHVPGRDMCLQLTDTFETNVNKMFSHFNSNHACQLLSVCTPVEEKTNEDQCRTCKNELDMRQYRFRTTINEVTTTLLSLCTNNECRSHVQSLQQETLDKINNIDSQNLCQHLGYCTVVNTLEPSATLLRLRILAQHQTKTLEERLQSNDICSEYGQLRPMCEHLIASPQSHRYAYMYMALLTNNPKLID